MRRNLKFIILTIFLMIVSGSAYAGEAADTPKRTIKGNMTEEYKVLPGTVTDIKDMFSQGVFYGRLRVNTFRWSWVEPDSKSKDNWAAGIGGSLIYKTAYLNGFGATAGLYTSQNPWHMDKDEIGFVKAGKDTFSRHEAVTHNGWGMTVLAQSYVEYKKMQSSLKAGRQIFESFLTKSNDTKMIPNTFEGFSLESKLIPDTSIKTAYLTQQKLRDHTTFHHVLAFGDDPNDSKASWNQNDDSAMHKGITLSKLKAADIDDELIVFEATNKTIPNLTVMANYTAVPELVWSTTGELNYSINFENGFAIVPGFRYMQQFDRKAGSIGSASLKAKITPTDDRGYTDPYNLDGALYAARIDMKKGPAGLMFGYSKVTDDGDIVAPWRGFPTGGYTRAMAQYNWYANTETYMVQAKYDFGKAKLIPGLSATIRYAIQDFDDSKPDVQADCDIFTLDLIQKVSYLPGLEFKGRMGIARGEDDTVDMNGKVKSDPSYNEYRVEMNYLF